MSKSRKPRIMQVVRTTRLVTGYPVGIPSGSLVTVKATGSGRFQIESPAGTLLWCDADAIEVIS